MVAGLLRQLGVHMGETLDEANQEDQDFLGHNGLRRMFWDEAQTARRADYIASIGALANQRDRHFDVWGWKDPLASYYIGDIHGKLRNPHYVLVTRDVTAIATREHLHHEGEDDRLALTHVRNALDEYGKLVEFVGGIGAPTVLISYERALRRAREVVDTIAEFVGQSDDALEPGQLAALTSYISPERGSAELGRDQEPERCRDADPPGARASWTTGLAQDALELIERGFVADLDLAFVRAADHWHRGETEEAITLAAVVLDQLSVTVPELDGGPAWLERSLVISPEAAKKVPQAAIGCLNILALAHLKAERAQFSCDLFSAGYAVAMTQVLGAGTSVPVAYDLVWWFAYHAAVSGEQAGRPLVRQRFLSILRQIAEGPPREELNHAHARLMLDRAKSEGLA